MELVKQYDEASNNLIATVKMNKSINYVLNVKNFKIHSPILDKLSVVLFLLFISLVGKDFLTGNYDGGKNWGAGASYVFLLLRVVLYLKIIYFFINTKHVVLNLPSFLKSLVLFRHLGLVYQL